MAAANLPTRLAHAVARWYNVLFGLYFYNLSRRKPDAVKQWIVAQVREQLGADYDVKTHFTPRYQPWDQRLCLAPDADFFQAIKTGKADVVTDQIERSPRAAFGCARVANLRPISSSPRPASN